MITLVRGILERVGQEEAILSVPPWEIEVWVTELTRRQIQTKLGEEIRLYTILNIEGNATMGRMSPRLIGFLSPVEREFFEVFCSVDGVGVRKALRAICQPVKDLARTIQDQDVATLATFPGVGEALAERIVAKLRRKVGKFALALGDPKVPASRFTASDLEDAPHSSSNATDPEIVRDVYAALLSVGHTETQARQAIDQALSSKKAFRSVADMINAIYQHQSSRRDQPAGSA